MKPSRIVALTFVASVLAGTAGSCRQVHSHGALLLDLTVTVLDKNKHPAATAAVYLIDSSPEGVKSTRRTLVCHTDWSGNCSSQIAHGFSYNSRQWRWETTPAPNPVLSNLTIEASAAHFETGNVKLNGLTRREVSGLDPIHRTVVVANRE